MRRPFAAANWKMNKTVGEAEDFVDHFIGSIGELDGVDVALCPPFTALAAVADRTRRSPGDGRSVASSARTSACASSFVL
jgi:triosephosphate isomerase